MSRRHPEPFAAGVQRQRHLFEAWSRPACRCPWAPVAQQFAPRLHQAAAVNVTSPIGGVVHPVGILLDITPQQPQPSCASSAARRSTCRRCFTTGPSPLLAQQVLGRRRPRHGGGAVRGRAGLGEAVQVWGHVVEIQHEHQEVGSAAARNRPRSSWMRASRSSRSVLWRDQPSTWLRPCSYGEGSRAQFHDPDSVLKRQPDYTKETESHPPPAAAGNVWTGSGSSTTISGAQTRPWDRDHAGRSPP